jgi:predicted GNAT family acetyltransferase
MSEISAGTSVIDVPSRQAFEARTSDGRVAGSAAYSRSADVVTLTHTEVAEEFRGHHVGDQLARVALEQIRAEGLHVDAQCSFVASFIEKNPEYQDLLV